MLPYLTIGPLSLPVPGLILIFGLWIGINTSEKFARYRGIDNSNLYNLVMVILVSAVVGARLGFIARYPSSYLANPLDVLSLNFNAADPWSGFAGGLLAWLIYSQRKQMPLLATLDSLTPLFAIEWMCVHLANLASGAAFGSETSLPWAIHLWGADRHPVQLYEAVGAAVIFLFLLLTTLQKENLPQGKIFFLFIGMSAGARLLLEAFHGDSVLVGQFRLIQIAAWAILAVSLTLLAKIDIAQAQH